MVEIIGVALLVLGFAGLIGVAGASISDNMEPTRRTDRHG